MASTVRIREEDKKILESLINYITFKTNKKITQEEMIALLVKTGSQEKDKLLTAIEVQPEEESDWHSDPIFKVKKVRMGKDASRSGEKDRYGVDSRCRRMGGVIFLDTSFIIAFFNEEDDLHVDAQNKIQKILTNDSLIKFYFTDYIFAETITQLRARKVKPESIEAIGETLLHSRLWRFLKISEVDFRKTWKMFKQYEDKEWSFTDVSSFVIMDTYKIPVYLSYDSHFSEYPKIKEWII